jgi:hypothetical protein
MAASSWQMRSGKLPVPTKRVKGTLHRIEESPIRYCARSIRYLRFRKRERRGVPTREKRYKNTWIYQTTRTAPRSRWLVRALSSMQCHQHRSRGAVDAFSAAVRRDLARPVAPCPQIRRRRPDPPDPASGGLHRADSAGISHRCDLSLRREV